MREREEDLTVVRKRIRGVARARNRSRKLTPRAERCPGQQTNTSETNRQVEKGTRSPETNAIQQYPPPDYVWNLYDPWKIGPRHSTGSLPEERTEWPPPKNPKYYGYGTLSSVFSGRWRTFVYLYVISKLPLSMYHIYIETMSSYVRCLVSTGNHRI